MVQSKLLGAAQLDRFFPLLGCPIATRGKQTMKHRQEEGPLDGKRELAILQQPTDHLLAAGLLPEPLEDHRRSDRSGVHGGGLPASMRRQQRDRFAELGPGAEQTFQLAALPELVEASERGDDALLAPAFLPAVFDDLQIDATSRLLLSKEHGALLYEPP